MQYSCCFTGHRPSQFSFGYNEDDPACLRIKQALYEQISTLASQGVCYFLTGMAQGVDIWAAEIVLTLKPQYPQMQLVCVLPCKTQAARWPKITQKRYYGILAKADNTKIISHQYTKTCMRERNHFLVDNAHFVLAVFNGKAQTGTAQTLNYAKQKHRAIGIISPADGSYSAFSIAK